MVLHAKRIIFIISYTANSLFFAFFSNDQFEKMQIKPFLFLFLHPWLLFFSNWFSKVACVSVRHTKSYLLFEVCSALDFTLHRKYTHEARFELFSSSKERFSSSSEKWNKKKFEKRGEMKSLCFVKIPMHISMHFI